MLTIRNLVSIAATDQSCSHWAGQLIQRGRSAGRDRPQRSLVGIQTALIRTRNRHSQTGNARSKNSGHPTGRKKRCLVTGESLGSMGDPITVTLKAKAVRVCCEACVAAVKRSPDRYLRKVAAEFARSVVAPRPAPQRQNISPSAALPPDADSLSRDRGRAGYDGGADFGHRGRPDDLRLLSQLRGNRQT